MKHTGFHVKKAAAFFISLAIGASAAYAVPATAKGADASASKAQTETNVSVVSGTLKTYQDYLSGYADAAIGKDDIVIPATSYTNDSSSAVLQRYNDYQGDKGTSVSFNDSGKVSFNFSVKNAGLYTIRFTYFTGSASGSSIVRDVVIDGAVPYAESYEISLPQLWSDGEKEKIYDANNNEVRSKQVQVGAWRTEYAQDVSGYTSSPLQYYLSEGTHTLALNPERENLLLKQIEITGLSAVPTYSEVAASYKKNGYKEVSSESNITIQAEDSGAYKSEQSMYPLNDRTSPSVSPYHVNLIRYNTVGASHWEVVGQWIEWTVEVRKTGLYNIATHFKQNLKTNDVSIRELYIDGKLPFREASSLTFYYDSSWQCAAFGDKEGNPYLFYLEKGTHTIRLKAGLGNSTEFLSKAKDYLSEMNRIYRKIVVITGTTPDPYRDYHLDKAIPEVIEDMVKMGKNIKALTDEVAAYNGQSGASTVALKRLYSQLDIMTEDTDKIATNLSAFKSNVSAFGTWINDELSQPLELDTIMLVSPKSKLPKGEAGIFSLLRHYVLQFFYSFVTDYEAVGVMEKKAESKLTVWLPTGRDQAQILKQMISDDFTPNNGIAVNLQLITTAALLPSILAGTGPDVYTGITQGEPINLAMRDALADLRQFGDFEEVASRFTEQAIVPFSLNGGTYALPDTVDYYMLFVRTDILEELGISLDKLNEWDTILSDVLPQLQINSLSFGVPVGIQSFLTFLYQTGGTMYNPDGKTSALATSKAINAMQSFSELYTQYGFNLAYDFANRFRSGEVPAAIANFTSYNQLSVFAPDIRGLWTMLPIPGTRNENGELDRSGVATVTGSVIMADSKNIEGAWEYLKWWSSANVQHDYGSELESIIGSAARYNTANIEALSNAQWDKDMKGNLLKQLKSAKAFVEVPGGYLTSRYYDFAFRYIVYDGDNVRDTMLESVASINREIQHKRMEYNLD